MGAKIMSDPSLGRFLGSGKVAEVFEFETAVIKLYKSTTPKPSAFREAAALALVKFWGYRCHRSWACNRWAIDGA